MLGNHSFGFRFETANRTALVPDILKSTIIRATFGVCAIKLLKFKSKAKEQSVSEMNETASTGSA